tara:strand:+ start:243 stop:1745 length:1503 start_codon:yes stop_codon:yes gene_type:complete
MDLKAILASKKSQVARSASTRKPTEIADTDRPYSLIEPTTAIITTEETGNKPTTNRQQSDNNSVTKSSVALPRSNDKIEIPLQQSASIPAVEKTNWHQTDNKVATDPLVTQLQNDTGTETHAQQNENQLVVEKNNTQKTDNKLATNRQQTDNKVKTNRQQTDNKPTTNSQQPVGNMLAKNQKWQQTGNESGNKTGNKVETKWQQTDNKVATKTVFSELVGLQRDIVTFICHECKNSRSRVTEALTLEHIAMSLKRSTGAIKTTIQRLEKKGCLTRVEFKNGRGGWSRYEVQDHIYHDTLRSESGNKPITKWQQTDNKVATEPTTELATSPSSSSSLNKITTTTKLEEEWDFDISLYNRFGFTTSQLKQLATLNVISATDVEQSLIEFSFDFDNNALPPIKTNKINFLMGLLRAGHSYVSEGFKNEQEEMIAEMARRSEGKRKNLLEAKFGAWAETLSGEELKAVENKLPTNLMVLHRTHGVDNTEVRTWLFNYYLQTCSG